MFRRFFQYIIHRIAGLRQDCQGFVVMSTLAIFLFLFLLCAFVYAVGETIHQRIKMQNACDAAAYSAAVVQADGLSRMAVVNRAMAWSYVQMTNRQMDYITYRWLKLTCKRFNEDKENAKKYNANIIFAVDKELGWWALLEMALSGLVSELFDFDCSGKLNDKVVTVGHKKEGHGWWCGLEIGDRKSHNIRLNHPKNEAFWDALKTSGIEAVTDQLSTAENLGSALSVFSFLDSGNGDNAETWATYLGKWIDYDKKNIYRMNKALARINKQMTISMRMTAESVLKSMLKDNRIDAENVLKNYYISIHIPEAEDPYRDAEPRSAAPKSFFSPLHNTEAEEMLFLNMHSTEAVSKSLFQHFPTLLGGTELPYGLDSWFIRGTVDYGDGKEHCYDASPLSDVSFVESADFHKATMIRKEGMLGIQRVYKDANLNETGAGFLAKERMKKVGEHQEQDVYHSRNFGRLPQCCKDACDYSNTRGSPNYYHIAKHDIYAKVPDEKHAVWRGNHLMDFMNVTNNLTNGLSSFINTNNASGMTDEEKMAVLSGQGIPTTAGGIADEDSLRQQMEQIRQDNIANGGTGVDNSVGQQPETTSGANQNQNQAASAKGNGNVLLNALSGAISNMIGNFLDVHPSCENDPKLVYDLYPSCQAINKGTTALYSEYRWASCKWYCLTKGYTYLVCILFGKDIYCDYPPAEMKVSFLGISFKVRVEGFCHVGWPKWFCGRKPHRLLIDIVPPLDTESISSDGKHGYMKTPLDFTDDGFLRPLKTLWGNEKDRTFSRREYESCAMFPDGLDNIPILGHYAWPGLIRGHSRIYGDDKEICDNRYVGARCQPWVLNERFFAGDGTIIVGAAMKHTNPLVQLFNFWNTKAEGDENSKSYTTGQETQENAEGTVLSAFNIPKGNFMWTMSAARAGVRHRRRDGAFDQARQYQITYDSTSDAENLIYSSGPYVFHEDGKRWISPDEWGNAHQDNPHALSRIHRPAGEPQEHIPIWNGCPCTGNAAQFRNLWNLCESDWDATLIPVRYAGQKAKLYLNKVCGGDQEVPPFNELDRGERRELIGIHITDAENNYSKVNGQNDKEKNDMVIGNGRNWVWNDVVNNTSTLLTGNPFIHANWKRADNSYFKDLFMSLLPEEINTGLSVMDGLNLNSKIPTGKEEKTIDVFTIFRDKVL